MKGYHPSSEALFGSFETVVEIGEWNPFEILGQIPPSNFRTRRPNQSYSVEYASSWYFYLFWISAFAVVVLSVLLYISVRRHRMTKDKSVNRKLILRVIHHDLSGSLTLIANYAAFRSSFIDSLTDEEIEALDNSYAQSAAAMNVLVENIYAWGRKFSGSVYPEEFALLDVTECVGDILKAYTPLLRDKDIEVDVEFKGVSTVFTEESVFQLIARNLLLNSVKHAPKGSEVKVSSLTTEDQFILEIENDYVPGKEDTIKKTMDIIMKGGVPRNSGLGYQLINAYKHIVEGELSYRLQGGKFTISFRVPRQY